MNKDYCIYISSPESICQSEWMKVFVNNLKMALKRTSIANLNFITKNKNDEIRLENIDKADVFIMILDSNDNTDEKYLNELYAISDKIQKSEQLSNFCKLYKVCLSPDKDIKQPNIFEPIKAYSLFEFSKRGRVINKFDFNNKEQNSKAWNLLLDLAFDFRDSIDVVTETAPQEYVEDEKYIYLSRCSTELTSIRDELKREFKQMGYSVLPKSDTDNIFEEGVNSIKENLSKSSYVVQMLGEKYGEVKSKDRMSLLEKESVAISDAIKNMPYLQRLIWIPKFLKRKEQRQELFINRIKQKESNDTTEIIESSINEFKDILTQRLIGGQKVKAQVPIAGEIYLISMPETEHNTIKSLANSLNINIKTISYSQNLSLYNQHLNLLANCNNILIHWVNKDQFWLKSKLSDLVKAPGLGKTESYNNICILVNGISPDLTAHSSWLPNIRIIQHDNITELKEYFQTIIE